MYGTLNHLILDRRHAAAAPDAAEFQERRNLAEVPLPRRRLLSHRDRRRPHTGTTHRIFWILP